ncbi:MAG: NAD-dependent epimerase/dehydratase family protein [Pseudolabrys sp.]|nr:NAD-dependent epimerase/dehydratase family protein [Pseudolabrys sp.]
MRILITGGAGCLGSNLIEHWLPQGHDVLAIDDFATGAREALQSDAPALQVVEGNVADRALVERVFSDFAPTHVVHSAAAYQDPNDLRGDVATNIIGAINLIEASRVMNVERFVNFQTSLCYGPPQKLPIPVDHPCNPVASYGISKTAGEAYIAASGLPFISIRLASVIGPRLTIGAIPTFYQRLKAGKSVFCTTAVRDFLAMSDFLSFMDLALRPSAPVGIFNLGPGRGHSIEEVLVAIARTLGVSVPAPLDIRPVSEDDVENVVLDPSETKKAFGWQAVISFEEAIADMVRWYDAHGVSGIRSHLKPQVSLGSQS